MILITGGSFQGKTEFVKSHFGLSDNDFSEATQSLSELKNAKCICHFEQLVQHSDNSENDVKEIISANPDVIIILTEIGCGIIPIEKAERLYRENVGKIGCFLAKNADVVIRVVCGIPAVIKGELC